MPVRFAALNQKFRANAPDLPAPGKEMSELFNAACHEAYSSESCQLEVMKCGSTRADEDKL